MAEDTNKGWGEQPVRPEQPEWGARGNDDASQPQDSSRNGVHGEQQGGVSEEDKPTSLLGSPTSSKPDETKHAGTAFSQSKSSENVANRGDFTANPYVGSSSETASQPTQSMPCGQGEPTVNYGQSFGQAGQNSQGGQNVYGSSEPQYGQYAPMNQSNQVPQPGQQNQQSQPQSGATQQYGQGFSGSVPPAPGAPVGPGNGNGMPGNPGNPGNRNGATAVKRKKANSTVVTAVIAAVVTAVLCLGLGYTALANGWVPIHSASSMAGISSNNSGSGSATVKGGAAPDWAAVSKNVSNSVVSIQTQVQGGIAKGSGAIIDDKGHVVTNNHVISGGQNIEVTLANGQMYTAKVTGTDTTTDLAVLQIDNAPSGLKPVEFADSSKLAVGENIMAVGNPLGYDDTATTGIVSALNRPVSVMDDNNSQIVTNAVQIDAAINPGNSGGPTFNAAGQVVGINSSIATASSSSSSQSESGSIGIGFAIPSNLVKRVSSEIVKDGSVKHVMLGVTIKTAVVKADGINRTGAQVSKASNGGSAVSPGSPAAKAGLKEGDTIVGFNGNAVGSNEALLGYVRAASMGDKVKLTVVRNGKTMDVDLTLDQEEKQVSGSNRQERNPFGQGQDDQGQQGQGGQGDDGDEGDPSDPFGLW